MLPSMKSQLLASCGLLFATAAAAAQPKYLGMPIKAIDVHMHPGSYDTIGPLGKAFVLESLPKAIPDAVKEQILKTTSEQMLNPYGSMGIKKECEKAGLTACGLFAVYAPETWGITTNEVVEGYLTDKRNSNGKGKPYFFGLASISMQNWEMAESFELDKLRKALKNPGMKGIKLAFIHNNIPLDDPQYDSIYGVAREAKVPVYHHVGSSPLRKLTDFPTLGEAEEYVSSYDPSRLERVLSAYPDVTFIMGHMGFDFNSEGYNFTPQVYELATRYPNVVLEISAFGRATYDKDGKAMDSVLRNIKEKGLIDRTIYGSDGPGAPGGTEKYLETTLVSMNRVGYSFQEAEAVLSGNARRLFKLD